MATAMTPAVRLKTEMEKSRNFFALAHVILASTDEASIFGLLLDNHKWAPEGMSNAEIEAELGLKQSWISNALVKLRKKGVVGHRREGQKVYNFVSERAYKAVSEFNAGSLAF
jgi:DNA-binding transcriptional regulator PaaX